VSGAAAPADLSGQVIEACPARNPPHSFPRRRPLRGLRAGCDPADRRFGYAFTNCTNCGALTIVTGIPYDLRRQRCLHSSCAPTARRVPHPANRRFHAEPVACPACGPALSADGAEREALARAAGWLAAGEVVAIKGLGGYHLACDARSPAAVETLRARKGRGQSPSR
jgi:hydrogenase maturation protein HypF